MGPTCEVTLESDDGVALDAVLAAVAERIDRTRKGRAWDVWVGGRRVHVSVDESSPVVVLAAGCNGPEDYVVLRRLAKELVGTLGGAASEPVK